MRRVMLLLVPVHQPHYPLRMSISSTVMRNQVRTQLYSCYHYYYHQCFYYFPTTATTAAAAAAAMVVLLMWLRRRQIFSPQCVVRAQ